MPYITVEAHVDLDEFDDEDLVEELESRGYVCSKNAIEGLPDVAYIEHLATCGLVAEARREALDLVSKTIGRRLQ